MSPLNPAADNTRDSWLPPLPLIRTKALELRRRNVLMVVTVLFTVALPVLFYGIRLIYRLSDPTHNGPAGQPSALKSVASLMGEFGFVVAVALGATAATSELTDGMFRHLVITGRSRIALYLSRIPAGLAILLSLGAAGYAAAALATAYLGAPHTAAAPTPSAGALADVGLWLELSLLIGFTVGHGLAALMGQRTVPVILLLVLQIIITPALADHSIPYFVNVERLFVGVAMDQLQPSLLAGGTHIGPTGGQFAIPPMPTWAMATVILGWIAGWSAIGAWKTITRDA
jgi:ABC-type transport system involved in multi-copper enzyme maturation permease subunit